MTDPSNPKSEAEYWNRLVQAQHQYAQSLATLDILLFEESSYQSVAYRTVAD